MKIHMTFLISYILMCVIITVDVRAQEGKSSAMFTNMPTEEMNARYLQMIGKTTESATTPIQVTESSSVTDYCVNGDIEALRKYLDAGGDPNRDNAKGMSPPPLLLTALLSDQYDAAELLIKKGADINATAYGVSIATVFSLLLMDAKSMQYIGKSDRSRIDKLQRKLEFLNMHGASIGSALILEKRNMIGERAWKHASNASNILIRAECLPDSINLPEEQITLSSLTNSAPLETWLEQQSGKSNLVIAVTVRPGGDQAEMQLLDLCMKYNVRMFVHQVILTQNRN